MLDGFLVGAAEILGDPPAVMASALGVDFFVFLIARLLVGFGATDCLLFRRPRGSLFVGPEDHAVFPHRRA